jgi:hypothetical protein
MHSDLLLTTTAMQEFNKGYGMGLLTWKDILHDVDFKMALQNKELSPFVKNVLLMLIAL